MRKAPLVAIALLGILGVGAASAQVGGFGDGPGFGDVPGGFGDSRDRVKTSAAPAAQRVRPGSELPVAVIFEMDPRWHIWAVPQSLPRGVTVWDGAIVTEIEADANGPLRPRLDRIRWPKADAATFDFGDGAERFGVFEGRAVAIVPVTVAAEAAPGPASLTFRLTFQACDDRGCLAPVVDHEVALTVEIDPAAPAIDRAKLSGDFAPPPAAPTTSVKPGPAEPTSAGPASVEQAPIEDTSVEPTPPGGPGAAAAGGFALVLLGALFGGFLLNFTPCVLPIVPIKIMGLAGSAGSRGRTFALGVAMTAGVVAFWMGIGIAVASISNFATNQLFQYPIFPISVGAFIVVMAIGMCGLFSIQLPQFVHRLNPGHDTIIGSFFFGVMAAILSTPCTAPFMGAAIAGSVGQSAATVLSVFAAIGAGMALPYLILSANPKWIARMPRTGPASALLKQVMGLLMLAAAAYFVGVGVSGLLAKGGEPPSRAYWWAVTACVVAAGVWLAWRTLRITRSPARRAVFGGLGALAAVAAISGAIVLTDRGPIGWTYYTPDRLASALDDGEVVVLKFTAEWCANCHLLERTVINSDDVVAAMNLDHVTPMKVDITNRKAEGNALLTKYWNSIPYLVILRPDGTTAFAADWYGPGDVVGGIEKALNGPIATR
jgi:thiol:disulfide interchange protein DsbD